MLARALVFVVLVVALAAILLSLLRRAPQRVKSIVTDPEAPASALPSPPVGSKALGRDETQSTGAMLSLRTNLAIAQTQRLAALTPHPSASPTPSPARGEGSAFPFGLFPDNSQA